MKIHLIRHAPTKANIDGSMIRNYKNSEILKFPDETYKRWHETMDEFLPSETEPFTLLTGSALRCKQTADCLFPHLHDKLQELEFLNEFDCSGLGKRKFWEVNAKTFEKLVPITSEQMGFQTTKFLEHCMMGKQSVVAISHGMFIRYMFHFMTGNRDISAYDIINSYGFKFQNLDMLTIDMASRELDVRRFNF